MMAGFVLIVFFILTRFAGAWGVPYFGFTSERGSECRNNFTGYVCSPITLEEVNFYADLALPADTEVVSGTYRSTHDYQIDAVLEVPAASAAEALKVLNASFGKCQANFPSPLDTDGLTQLCTMGTIEGISADGAPASRLYVVGTGLRADGTRPIVMTIKSR